MAIFVVHFIYRYLVISGNSLLKTFNSWKIILWLLIPISSFLIWFSVGAFLSRPTLKYTEFIRKDFRRVFHEDVGNFLYLGGFSAPSNGVGSLVSLIAIEVLFVSVVLSFVLIITFGSKCYLCILRFTRNKSRSSKSLQSQLFFALVIQTIIPAVLMHFPVAVKIAWSMFSDGIGEYCALVSMAIAIYPAIDPLPYFFIIPHYRKAICGKVLFWY
uniref:Uncharacterized protein n=1 Tax=Caenorhabditis japonica TaxID=281687 RepID=A0A8R1DHQ4_CAEJA